MKESVSGKRAPPMMVSMLRAMKERFRPKWSAKRDASVTKTALPATTAASTAPTRTGSRPVSLR